MSWLWESLKIVRVAMADDPQDDDWWPFDGWDED